MPLDNESQAETVFIQANETAKSCENIATQTDKSRITCFNSCVSAEQSPFQYYFRKYLRIKNQTAREFLAELLGTFILCVFGLAAIAQFKFFGRDGHINFLAVNFSFGFGATLAILVVGKISGAHLNPAVSFSMFLTGRLSILRFLTYCLAQYIGAFLAALTVFLVYLDLLRSFQDKMYDLDLAGIFATYPNKHLSLFGGFLDQLIGTALLIIVVLALTDKKNVEASHGTCAILVGIALIAIGASFGYNCGYAVNPARDFGPRFLTLIVGFGTKTFTASQHFFWIPLIAPMVGAFMGTLIYTCFISAHWI